MLFTTGITGKVDPDDLANGSMDDPWLRHLAMAFFGDVPEIPLVVCIAYPNPLNPRHGGEVDTSLLITLEGVAVSRFEVFMFELQINGAIR